MGSMALKFWDRNRLARLVGAPVPGVAIAALVLLLAGCGVNEHGTNGDGTKGDPNGRKFSQTYQVHLDSVRTLEVRLTGSFTAREDKSRADAGQTDLYIKSHAEAKVTNVSDGRITDRYTHGVRLFVPMDHCPSWVKRNSDSYEPLGTHCSYDLFQIEVGELKAGDSQTVEIEDDKKFPPVAAEDAATELNGILGPSGVLVGTGDMFTLRDLFESNPTEFNPTCERGSNRGRSITYFSESPEVNACS